MAANRRHGQLLRRWVSYRFEPHPTTIPPLHPDCVAARPAFPERGGGRAFLSLAKTYAQVLNRRAAGWTA
ncbi:hypothetical protein D9M70_233700 [compost metagenome]